MSKEVHTTTGSTKAMQQEDSGAKTRLGLEIKSSLRDTGESLKGLYI
jgi:hypothetical protein